MTTATIPTNPLRLLPFLRLELTAPLSATATTLPLTAGDARALADQIGTADTYLTLAGPAGGEVVMAWATGTTISILRGQNGTPALAHPAGTCVGTGAWVECAIRRLVCEQIALCTAATG